jgi:hypothetical protein
VVDDGFGIYLTAECVREASSKDVDEVQFPPPPNRSSDESVTGSVHAGYVQRHISKHLQRAYGVFQRSTGLLYVCLRGSIRYSLLRPPPWIRGREEFQQDNSTLGPWNSILRSVRSTYWTVRGIMVGKELLRSVLPGFLHPVA